MPSNSKKLIAPTDTKKMAILICLVIFWIGLIIVQRYSGSNQRPPQRAPVLQDASGQREGSAGPARSGTKERATMPRLKLGRIERVRPPYEPEVRNIFASIDQSLPVAALPPAPSAPPVLSAPSAPPPPDPFVEEAKKVRFLGYAEGDGKAMAFVGYGSEILVVPETEVFGSQFRVKQVKEDGMIVTSLDGTKETLVGLSPASGVAPPKEDIGRGKQP